MSDEESQSLLQSKKWLACLYTYVKGDRSGFAGVDQMKLLDMFPKENRRNLCTSIQKFYCTDLFFQMHPNVLSFRYWKVDHERDTLLTIQPLIQRGSIHQQIEQNLQKSSFRHLCSPHFQHSKLFNQNRIQNFTYQILRTLLILHHRRIPYFHCLSENILIKSKHQIVLSGFQWSLFGLSFPHQKNLLPLLWYQFQNTKVTMEHLLVIYPFINSMYGKTCL